MSSILSVERSESISQWLKFVPRLLFCYLMGTVLLRKMVVEGIIKLLIIIGVVTVIQYVFLETAIKFGIGEFFRLDTHYGGNYYGPLGILGNATAEFSIFFQIPKFRLQGFWLEPSTAAGFLLSAYFLSQALYTSIKKIQWKIAGFACLGGGIFAFSNAGFFALGGLCWLGR